MKGTTAYIALEQEDINGLLKNAREFEESGKYKDAMELYQYILPHLEPEEERYANVLYSMMRLVPNVHEIREVELKFRIRNDKGFKSYYIVICIMRFIRKLGIFPEVILKEKK